jgi:uncharacterized protein YecT (DUF1311 family)
MVYLKIIGLLIFLGQSFLSVGQTQLEMNSEARNRLREAEAELTKTVSTIQKLYHSDAEFLKNFKTSQAIWTQFKSAELKMKFPDQSPGYYGSVYPMCVAYFLTSMTLQRVAILKVWVTGIEEGDVCSGSVRIKD